MRGTSLTLGKVRFCGDFISNWLEPLEHITMALTPMESVAYLMRRDFQCPHQHKTSLGEDRRIKQRGGGMDVFTGSFISYTSFVTFP